MKNTGHNLWPHLNNKLPFDYKLGYKVCRLNNFEFRSCVMSDKHLRSYHYDLPKDFDKIIYRYYKWTQEPDENHPLVCFNVLSDAKKFTKLHFHDFNATNNLPYIVPCVYVESIWSEVVSSWFSEYTFIIIPPDGTQLASKIMLVGGLIIP